MIRSLTKREVEVANLYIRGLTRPQIAKQLFIARGTVTNHIDHIYAKLEVCNKQELLATMLLDYGIELGLPKQRSLRAVRRLTAELKTLVDSLEQQLAELEGDV
jgi:DNA-binding CsgD family transcriptional regulator